MTPSSEILALTDPPLLKAASFDTFCLVAPQPQERKRSSITLNKKSTRAFQRAINQGSTPPLTSSKRGQIPKFFVFWTISTIKDEKSAAKFHYIKTVRGKVVAQSIAFRVVSTYWQG